MNQENQGVRGKLVTKRLATFLFFMALAVHVTCTRAAVYQYSVRVADRRAYLWIPPNCMRVRGVMIALNNLLEQAWLADPIVRKAAAEEGIAIIFVGRGKQGINAQMSGTSAEGLSTMLKDFAEVSGYDEIETAPLFSMGHSQNGFLAWTIASWNPDRTIAAFPIKTHPLPDNSIHIEGVPLCYLVGQTTEWPEPNVQQSDRDFYWPVVRDTAIRLRSADEDNLVGVVTEAGAGHFDWSEHSAKFLALYLHKACYYRLPKHVPATGPITLKKIDKESGWLTDTGGMDADRYAPAPYRQYRGDPKKAYWFFDEETARAAVAFEGDRIPRKKQLLSFVLPDGGLSDVSRGPASVPFVPASDGVTFKIKPGFLATIPPQLVGGGSRIRHAGSPISLRVIVGPAVQMDAETFRVQLNRNEQGGTVFIQAENPGDGTYRRAVQPGSVEIPAANNQGAPQAISFPEIPNQKRNVKTVALQGTSDAHLPVDYYIVAGPAELDRQPDGSVHALRITDVPIKAKYPIAVTVVAYQYGRSVAPQVQSAAPVTRTFFLER